MHIFLQRSTTKRWLIHSRQTCVNYTQFISCWWYKDVTHSKLTCNMPNYFYYFPSFIKALYVADTFNFNTFHRINIFILHNLHENVTWKPRLNLLAADVQNPHIMLIGFTLLRFVHSERFFGWVCDFSWKNRCDCNKITATNGFCTHFVAAILWKITVAVPDCEQHFTNTKLYRYPAAHSNIWI